MQKIKIVKITILVLYFIIVAALMITSFHQYEATTYAKTLSEDRIRENDEWLIVIKRYNLLNKNIMSVKQQYSDMNIDFWTEENYIKTLRKSIADNNIDEAIGRYGLIKKSYEQKVRAAKLKRADEAKKGQISGRVMSEEQLVSNVEIKFFNADTEIGLINSNDGNYSYRYYGGKYTARISKTGYNDLEQKIDITPQQQTNLDLVLSKPTLITTSYKFNPAAPSAIPVSGSSFFHELVKTDNGDFYVSYMTFDPSAVEMIVDTAVDGDCFDNCPVKSLGEYVRQNNAFAGIAGNYFCPASYPECQGKINSFDMKLYNGRLGKTINWNKNSDQNVPFFFVDNSRMPHYFNTWLEAKDQDISSGISGRPWLISNGQVIVTFSDLDSDKERYKRIDRGFIGLRGQTIFAGYVEKTTVLEEASALKSLGLDNALNLDGGGTTALYYNGYRLGPGRNMPNAIVFKYR